MPARTTIERRLEPGAKLRVDEDTRRFYALVDPTDGTLVCEAVGAAYDAGPDGTHDRVHLFTTTLDAKRAASLEYQDRGMLPMLEVVEVSVIVVGRCSTVVRKDGV